MANNQKLDISELDFDAIKSNLKTFLKNQDQFLDYDFEGSGMSALLDVLAYNTHYLSFHANMVANEMFIDSAALRSSVVSHAKTLGYEVRSVRSPKARVNVFLNDRSLSTATMNAGQVFTTKIDNVNYQNHSHQRCSRTDHTRVFSVCLQLPAGHKAGRETTSTRRTGLDGEKRHGPTGRCPPA